MELLGINDLFPFAVNSTLDEFIQEKKALYGTFFLPIVAGHQLTGILSGDVYDKAAGKLTLLLEECINYYQL